MVRPVIPEVRVLPDAEALSCAAAAWLAGEVQAVLRTGGSCAVALAGGGTPRRLYGLLATEFREQIPWDGLHLFWGDERYVPWDDPRSNYRLVRETLLDRVPVPADHVHPMPTDLPEPENAARAYERTLRDHFAAALPRFDLVLLGLGADGHTASLFAGSPALDEETRWVVAVRVAAEPPVRLTLTRPVLNHAAQVHFLVTGDDKAGVLRQVLSGAADPRRTPAAAVRPSHGTVIWWVDAGAARLLEPSLRSRKARE